MTTMPRVTTAEEYVDEPDQIAPTRRSTPGHGGGHVPGRLAGYTWDGAAYCPECAGDVFVEIAGEPPEGALEEAPEVREGDHGQPAVPIPYYPPFSDDGEPITDPRGFGVGVVSGLDEADYGFSCHICHRLLDTNVLTYERHE
jgi:hypothetical protein